MYTAKLILHKGEARIAIYFANTIDLNNRIKKIEGARWSQTLKAWHLPDNKEYRERFKLEITPLPPPALKSSPVEKTTSVKSITSPPLITTKNTAVAFIKTKGVIVQVLRKKIIIQLPKNDLDTQFISSFKYSRWDKKQFCWIVPNYKDNLGLLKNYFKQRITELIIQPQSPLQIGLEREIGNNDLLLIKTKSGRIKLFFNYN